MLFNVTESAVHECSCICAPSGMRPGNSAALSQADDPFVSIKQDDDDEHDDVTHGKCNDSCKCNLHKYCIQ